MRYIFLTDKFCAFVDTCMDHNKLPHVILVTKTSPNAISIKFDNCILSTSWISPIKNNVKKYCEKVY